MQVEQHGEEYQNQSWGPVIALVKDNRPPAGKVLAAKDRGTVKEMFLTLNDYIQVSHRQTSCTTCSLSTSVRSWETYMVLQPVPVKHAALTGKVVFL